MIYAVDKESRLIYEVRPLGETIMIRPAEVGMEHMIERVPAIAFGKIFDNFLAMFLIPNQLDEEDFMDVI